MIEGKMKNLQPRASLEPEKINGARWIALTQNKWALVDENDYELVSQYNWSYTKDKNAKVAYAKAWVNGKIKKMHKVIMGPSGVVYFKDGNTLDNRRCNLLLKQCKHAGCTKPLYVKDLCNKHYWGRHKSINAKKYRKTYWSENKNRLKIKAKEYQVNNRRLIKNMELKRLYNITIDQFDDLLLKQNGKCAICFTVDEKTLHVDHDHKTGKVRALLCDRCNRGLGYFMDDVQILTLATEYLRKHSI